MNKLLTIASVAEAGTGAALLADPQLVIRLLFGAEAMDAGIVVGRIAGIALLGLGVACWPGKTGLQPIYGMLAYSALAMLYLIYIGLQGTPVGPLLWPATVVHALLAGLLARARFEERKTPAA